MGLGLGLRLHAELSADLVRLAKHRPSSVQYVGGFRCFEPFPASLWAPGLPRGGHDAQPQALHALGLRQRLYRRPFFQLQVANTSVTATAEHNYYDRWCCSCYSASGIHWELC